MKNSGQQITQLVYVERAYEENESRYRQKVYLLNDSVAINSLRDNYKCNLKDQCDGDKEYEVYMFRDHMNKDWNLFCEKKFFSFGNLRPLFIPVNTSYVECPNSYRVKIVTDSLSGLEIPYTISPVDTVGRGGAFSYVLNIDVNIESKLWKNNDSTFSSWTPNARKELQRLYPELQVTDVSFSSNNLNDSYYPPASMKGYNAFTFYHKELRYILSSDRPFELDLSRLNGTDLFRAYYVNTAFVVTAFTNK